MRPVSNFLIMQLSNSRVALFDSYRAFDINSIKEETVHVHYLDPIPYDQYVGLKTVEIADLVESRIRQKIEENMLKKWA